MAQVYYTATSYAAATRSLLQDFIAPYRYSDSDVVSALNRALDAMGRLRPDIFLDLKYQQPLRRGDTDDGNPGVYSLSDIFTNPDGSYDTTQGTLVPVPNRYRDALEWFMAGWLQLYDVADAQDQRAAAFLTKFQQHLLQLSAA
jgi:hypothetical protein